MKHTSVIIPFTTNVSDLPKGIRHEIDEARSTSELELHPGHHSVGFDDDDVLMDIKAEGYHVQGGEIIIEGK
jgi:hypothetical protein